MLAALFIPSNRMSSLIATATPNQAVVVATIGVCLIFVEFNRPGRVVPGALGLTLVLLAAASLAHHPLQGGAVLALLLTSAALITNVWRRLPLWLAGLLSIALGISLRFLIPHGANPHINTASALTCGLAVGLLGTALSRIALRARRLKAVH